jgi:hypothetical protein
MSKRDAEEYVVAFSKYWKEKRNKRIIENIDSRLKEIVPYKVTIGYPEKLNINFFEWNPGYDSEKIKKYTRSIFTNYATDAIILPADTIAYVTVITMHTGEGRELHQYRKNTWQIDRSYANELLTNNFAVRVLNTFKRELLTNMKRAYLNDGTLFKTKNLFVNDNYDPEKEINPFEENEVESSSSETALFLDFSWGNKTGPQNNHYTMFLTLFKKFAHPSLANSINNKKSLKSYIIEKHLGSTARKDLETIKINLNAWFYSLSVEEKVNKIFKPWSEYELVEKSDGYFVCPEIDSLFQPNNSSYSNWFALTKTDEIIFLSNSLLKLYFCYQIKTSDIVGEEKYDSYLNFLINGSLKLESGDIIKTTFPLEHGATRIDVNNPLSGVYNVDINEKYAKVNLMLENGNIVLGNPEYWSVNNYYSNRDNIFKTGARYKGNKLTSYNDVERDSSGVLHLEKSDLAKNAKLCVAGINLNKKYPSFSLFEKMNRQEIIDTIIHEEYALTPDLVAIDDIVALFEFNDSELKEIKVDAFNDVEITDTPMELTITIPEKE